MASRASSPATSRSSRQLRASGTPILAVVNKIDVRKAREAAMQFYELGIDPLFEVSAEHGTGVGDLLDEIVRRLEAVGPAATDADQAADEHGTDTARAPRSVRAATRNGNGGRHRRPAECGQVVAGQPVAARGADARQRDARDDARCGRRGAASWHKREFRIVDTAGIRRPGRVGRSGQVESLSVLVARRAIEKADVVVLVIDATVGATDQDAAIAGEADKQGRGVIIVANKWDLVKEQRPDFSKEFDEELRRH